VSLLIAGITTVSSSEGHKREVRGWSPQVALYRAAL